MSGSGGVASTSEEETTAVTSRDNDECLEYGLFIVKDLFVGDIDVMLSISSNFEISNEDGETGEEQDCCGGCGLITADLTSLVK